MSNKMNIFIYCSSLFVHVQVILATVDLNLSELEYLSNHLQPEECRRLVAAAHFKSLLPPNALGEAEMKVPKDIPCIDLLLHWNSADGEGKGETHEVLERRLRQMGKIELADWLGRTVFRELGVDLEQSLKAGLERLANETTSTQRPAASRTLQPPIAEYDPREWTPFDTICFTLLISLIVITLGLCGKVAMEKLARRKRSKQYHTIQNESGSDSEQDVFVKKVTSRDSQ